MKCAVICSFSGAVALSISCVTLDYNKFGSNESFSQNAEFQVNPMAFNALKIWNGEVEPDGSALKEILEYSVNYPSLQGKTDADEVHYSEGSEFNPKVIATPKPGDTRVGNAEMGYPDIKLTEGLKIEKDGDDDVLIYPVNEKSKKALSVLFYRPLFRHGI